jgi:hypothetical protein
MKTHHVESSSGAVGDTSKMPLAVPAGTTKLWEATTAPVKSSSSSSAPPDLKQLFPVAGGISSEMLFPWKLHGMLGDLERDGRESVASWMPEGTAFKIHNRPEFSKLLLVYFKHTQFKSFQRQVRMQLRKQEVGGGLTRARFVFSDKLTSNSSF